MTSWHERRSARVVRDPDEGLGHVGIVHGELHGQPRRAPDWTERALDAPRPAGGDPGDEPAGIPVEEATRCRPAERPAGIRGSGEGGQERDEQHEEQERAAHPRDARSRAPACS